MIPRSTCVHLTTCDSFKQQIERNDREALDLTPKVLNMAKPVIKNSDMGPELSEKALRIATEAVDIEATEQVSLKQILLDFSSYKTSLF